MPVSTLVSADTLVSTNTLAFTDTLVSDNYSGGILVSGGTLFGLTLWCMLMP